MYYMVLRGPILGIPFQSGWTRRASFLVRSWRTSLIILVLLVKSDKRSQIDSKTSSPEKINSLNWGETTKI